MEISPNAPSEMKKYLKIKNIRLSNESFKFGGASVRDAEGVKNLVSVLKEVGYDKTIVVVSAMGKTTNALEKILDNYFNDSKKTIDGLLQLKQYHIQIVKNLFGNDSFEIEETINKLLKNYQDF